MPALEYGSYYWCVLLAGDNEAQPDSIHLHADEMSIEGGSLIFKSSGRRPAGTDPNAEASNSKGSDSGNGDLKEKSKEGSDSKNMIYVAFAPGSWKMVYAAKLQDGSPASIEHWGKAPAGGLEADRAPRDAGAVGYAAETRI
jgi:hypothetical protein